MPHPQLNTARKRINFLNKVPKILSGESSPRTKPEREVRNIFFAYLVHSLFEQVYDAYVVKTTLASDDIGISWPDISEYTKAYKKPSIRKKFLSAAQKRRLKDSSKGLLSKKETKEWRKIYATTLFKLGGREENVTSEDEQTAAQVAWDKIKQSGGQTLIGELGKVNVPVMVETTRLMKSLKPGKVRVRASSSRGFFGKYKKSNKDQIAVLRKGYIEIGTAVEYADDAAKMREFLPDPIPDKWYNEAEKEALEKVYEAIYKWFI